ncbi:hypothetical protein [Tenacibaculum soleae]|uniref:hypothetical protein n=1 Tax=Tenacibaculum soleae TaxID=447689 RepID=UPI0023000317|nr:hypothetical protein [Tenacibaculum soleae]
MKKIFNFIILLTFLACGEKDEIIEFNSLNSEIPVSLHELDYNLVNFYNQFSNQKAKSKNLIENEKLLDPIILNTKKIMARLGLKEIDLINASLSNQDIKFFYSIIGANFAKNHLLYNNTLLLTKKNNSKSRKGGDLLNCLGEAVGINALITLGDAAYTLYAGEITAGFAVDAAAAAAFRKAALKAATGIIGRFATGLGAVYATYKFVDCMLSSTGITIPIYTETNLTCNDLVYLSSNYYYRDNYHLLKTDIDYISDNSFDIDPSKLYNIYFIVSSTNEYGLIDNCGTVMKTVDRVWGSELDGYTIKPFFKL